VSSNWR